MAKLIVVTGSTGRVGGSVARRMLQEGWRVRAVTRNTSGEAAKKLNEQGAEIVSADYDDEESLAKAFKVGTHSGTLYDEHANTSHPCSGRTNNLRPHPVLGAHPRTWSSGRRC